MQKVRRQPKSVTRSRAVESESDEQQEVIDSLTLSCEIAEIRGEHSKVLELQRKIAKEKKKQEEDLRVDLENEHRSDLEVLEYRLQTARMTKDCDLVLQLEGEIAQAKRDFTKKMAKRSKMESYPETRLRRFRSSPSPIYPRRLNRVQSRRMFLVGRQKGTSNDGFNEVETFVLVGTTGNIHHVTIDRVPTCSSCPSTTEGTLCRHIIYVLINVLQVPDNFAYQEAFLSYELHYIFATAPETPQASFKRSSKPSNQRKPVNGDCPVCMMEFEKDEDIIWCKATCGNNIHRECQQQWAKSKGGVSKCVFCRSPWQEDDEHKRKKAKLLGESDANRVRSPSTQTYHDG